MRRLLITAFVAIAVAPALAHAQPSNDAFDSAATVASIPFSDVRDTSGATRESGEPYPSCAWDQPTIWYRFATTTPAVIGVTTAGSDDDTFVAVYQGASFAELKEVACSSTPPSEGGTFTGFVASPGTEYHVQVGSVLGTNSAIRFRLDYGEAISEGTGGNRVSAAATGDDAMAGAVVLSQFGAFVGGSPEDVSACAGVHSLNCIERRPR